MCFASNPLKKYNSLFKPISRHFVLKTPCFPNYKDIHLKSAFWIKSAQRIQLAAEKCVPRHFVVRNPF